MTVVSPKRKPGRPTGSTKGQTVPVLLRLSPDQVAYLKALPATVSATIRALVERAMEKSK